MLVGNNIHMTYSANHFSIFNEFNAKEFETICWP